MTFKENGYIIKMNPNFQKLDDNASPEGMNVNQMFKCVFTRFLIFQRVLRPLIYSRLTIHILKTL